MERGEQEGGGGAQRSVRWMFQAWAAYWAALPVVALWTPATLFLRLQQQMPGRAAFTIAADERLNLRLTVDRASVWAAGISYAELVAWLAGPPLVLWVAWLWWTARGTRRVAPRGTIPSVEAAQSRQLGGATPLATLAGAAGRAREGVRAPVDRAH